MLRTVVFSVSINFGLLVRDISKIKLALLFENGLSGLLSTVLFE